LVISKNDECGVSVSAINQHIKILTENQKIDISTIKKYLMVQKKKLKENK